MSIENADEIYKCDGCGMGYKNKTLFSGSFNFELEGHSIKRDGKRSIYEHHKYGGLICLNCALVVIKALNKIGVKRKEVPVCRVTMQLGANDEK